jgi:hypothetical protein
MTKRLDVGDKYANFIGRLTDAERKELGDRLAAQAVVRMLKRARPYLAMAEKLDEKAK